MGDMLAVNCGRPDAISHSAGVERGDTPVAGPKGTTVTTDVDQLLARYELGRISRRQLLICLAAAAATAPRNINTR